MNRYLVSIALLATCALAGCQDKNQDQAAPGASSSAATPTAPANNPPPAATTPAPAATTGQPASTSTSGG